MAEKRFTLTFDDKIVDNLTNVTHAVHSGYDVALDLSNLLNKLWEQTNRFAKHNGELEKENDELKHTICYLEERIEEYIGVDTENDRLKQFKEKALHEVYDLNKENEHLKKELSDFKKQVYDFEDIVDLKNWQQKYEDGDVE